MRHILQDDRLGCACFLAGRTCSRDFGMGWGGGGVMNFGWRGVNELWSCCPKWVTLILGHNTECDDFQSAGQKYLRFLSKLDASGIILFENITSNGQMSCFMTVSGIINCNCCSTVVCKTNFLSPISQNGILYSSQIELSITFEPVGRFAQFWYHLKGKWMLFTRVQNSKFHEMYQCDSFQRVGSQIPVCTESHIQPPNPNLHT